MRRGPLLYEADPWEITMSKPLVVSIPHRLGKDEAVRRLKNGLGSASANFGHVFKVEEANLDRTSPAVSDQRAWPSGKRLNRCGRGLRSIGGVSAMAPGEARRNTAAADPQGRYFVIGKEIKKLNCSTWSGMYLLEAGQCYRRSLRSFEICSSSSA